MSNQNLLLTDKVALITGGKRGIGKVLALAFAEAGADVAVCDIVHEDGMLENTVKEIEQIGKRSLSIKADVTDKSEVDNMMEQVIDYFGSIDILVNNAGVHIIKPLMEFSEDEWDKIIDIDLKGCFFCAQAAGRKMIGNKKGNIINIASQLAFTTDFGNGVYSIAKSGVVMLTRVLARELGTFGIRSNAIAPGMVKTELNRPVWSNSSFMTEFLKTIPLGRVNDPIDLVGTALFLASDASSHISGHTIHVDGGRLA